MFRINTPRFNLDGSSEGGDWGSIAQSALSEESVDEGQSVADPDTEELETAEITDTDDVVEPDGEPEQEEEASTSPFDDEAEVELGEGRQPVKFAELKQGYLRQSDYTKKTQALATERQTFETERASWEPAKQTDEFLRTNPWLAQQINSFIQEFKNTGSIPIEEAMQDMQYGQYINTLVADVTRLTLENQSLRGDYEGIKLTSEMTGLQNDLKAEYGELVTPEYIQSLQERGKAEKLSTATLKDIAEGYLTKQQMQQNKQDVKKVTKETQAKTIQSLQEKRSSLPPQPKQNGQRPGDNAPDTSTMDWMQMAKMAAGKM